MAADLTADIRHTLYCGFPASYILSKHKECRMCIVFFQTVKKFISVFSWTIIKSKCNSCLMLTRIISTIIVEVIIIKSDFHPSGLYVTVIIKVICRTIDFLHTAGEICTICILIPFTVFIVMPSGCKLCRFRQIALPFDRLAYRRVCFCTRISCICTVRTAVSSCAVCLCLYLLWFLCISATGSVNNRKNDSADYKNQYQNDCNDICTLFHHLPPSYLLLLFAHSFAQYPLIH